VLAGGVALIGSSDGSAHYDFSRSIDFVVCSSIHSARVMAFTELLCFESSVICWKSDVTILRVIGLGRI